LNAGIISKPANNDKESKQAVQKGMNSLPIMIKKSKLAGKRDKNILLIFGNVTK
jgi:hypothetical protein